MASASTKGGLPFKGFKPAVYEPAPKSTGDMLSMDSRPAPVVLKQAFWHAFSMVVVTTLVVFCVLDHFAVSLKNMELHKSQTWLWWAIAVVGSSVPGLVFSMKSSGPYTFYGFAAFAYGAVSSIVIYAFDHVHGTYLVFETRYENDQFATATVSPTFLLVMGHWAAVRSILLTGFIFLGASYFTALRVSRSGGTSLPDKYP